MKLSAAIRDKIRFQVERIPGRGGTFLPFQGCMQLVFPDATADIFPLAFACPLFVGTTQRCVATEIVNEILPEGAKLPDKAGIYFLCDAIDCMAVRLKFTEAQVAEIVERIEQEFEARGLDEQGRKKGKGVAA